MAEKTSRILSRKLAFLYFYARLFNEDIIAQPIEEEQSHTQQPTHEDLTELTDWLGVTDEDLAVEEDAPVQPIKAMDDSTMTDDIEFIAQHQLAQHTTSQTLAYDHDFVMQLTTGYTLYRPLIAGLTNPYTDKFGYDEMSLTRRAILLLGYTEYTVINTPGTIVINECVELAKSYEDVSAAKLINGIFHHLFDIKEEDEKKEIKVVISDSTEETITESD